MRKSLVVLVIVLAFLVQGASYSTGDSISLNGTSYDLIVLEDFHVIFRLGNTTALALEEGDCDDFGMERLCFTGKPNNETATLERTDLEPDITIEISQDRSSLWVGERRRFRAKIHNSGNFQANNLTFILDLPHNLSVESLYGCESYDNVVLWSDNLSEGSEHVCEFTLYGRASQLVALKGMLSYNHFGEEKTVELDDLEFDIRSPFRFNLKSPPQIVVGDQVDMVLNITNNLTQNITVGSLNLIQEDYFEKLDEYRKKQVYRLLKDNLIRPNQTRSLDFRLHMLSHGVKELPLFLSYSLGSTDAEYMLPLVVNISKPESTLEVNAPSDVTGQKTINASISLRSRINVTNASVIFTTPQATKEFTMATDKNISISVPAVRSRTEYTYDVEVSYQDEYMNRYHLQKKFTITAHPLKRLQIKKNITRPDGTPHLQITVVNPLNDSVDVIVEEKNLFFSKRTEVNVDKEMIVFSLPLREGGMLLSNTTIRYEKDGLNMTLSNPTMIDLESLFPEKNTTNTTQVEEVEESFPVVYLFIPLGLVILMGGYIFWHKQRKQRGAPPGKVKSSKPESEANPEKTETKDGDTKYEKEGSKEESDDRPEKTEPKAESRPSLFSRLIAFLHSLFHRTPEEAKPKANPEPKPERPHDRQGLIDLKQRLDAEITELLKQVNPTRNQKAYDEEQEYLEVTHELEDLEKDKQNL
ncbi:MAG: hypothetical protein ACQESG_06540 [Nanobdellota archaeon]